MLKGWKNNWDVRAGAILALIGLAGEAATEAGLANTKIGRWLIAIGLIASQLRSKSVAVTGTGDGAERAKDVNNVPLNSNPNR